MKEVKFKDLFVDHDYYCSDSNYYSNEVAGEWDTWADFYNEYKDADIDMNLVFRWDMEKRENSEFHVMKIYQIGQRKGKFVPHYIKMVHESDLPTITIYLQKHADKLAKIWDPFDLGKRSILR